MPWPEGFLGQHPDGVEVAKRRPMLLVSERVVANIELSSKAKWWASVHKGSPGTLHKDIVVKKGPTGHQDQRRMSRSSL